MNNVVSESTFTMLRGLVKTGNGDGGTIDTMEARLTEVEKAIVRIDAVLPHLATKEDVKEGSSSTQRWMVATVIGMMVGFGGLFMAMSNALKPGASGQPTVIVLGGQATGSAIAPQPPIPSASK